MILRSNSRFFRTACFFNGSFDFVNCLFGGLFDGRFDVSNIDLAVFVNIRSLLNISFNFCRCCFDRCLDISNSDFAILVGI